MITCKMTYVIQGIFFLHYLYGVNFFEEEVNDPLRGKVDKLLAKKKSNLSRIAIVYFFCYPISLPKRLYVAKNIS